MNLLIFAIVYFMQEIESLLKDVIIHQIENEDRKSKKHLTECKILTGMLQLNSFVEWLNVYTCRFSSEPQCIIVPNYFLLDKGFVNKSQYCVKKYA